MTNKLLSIIKEFRERTRDPVKHCLVYRAVGCAHVDGMLCNVRTCTIKAVIEVRPMTTKEVDPLPDNAPLIGAQHPHRADGYRAGTQTGEKHGG